MKRIIGTMSGTSCDGLDVVYCEIENSFTDIKVKPLYFEAYDYDDDFRNHLLHLTSGKVSVAEISHANFYIAEKFSECINDFIEKYALYNKIDLIVSHGQTVYHDPYGKKNEDKFPPCTLQIGDGDVISVRTENRVLSDLRMKDMAVKGQGAPLVVYSDYVIFSEKGKNVALQNIGGIGNVTYIPSNNELNEVMAFDTGPGNVLIDMAAKKLFNEKYDISGNLSANGESNSEYFNFLKEFEVDYMDINPPKSTGKEMRYNKKYFETIFSKAEEMNLNKNDILRTIVKFTAWTICESYKKYLNKIDLLYITGGGALNTTLVQEITKVVNCDVKKLDSMWTEAKEAIAFAVMGNEYLNSHFANVKSSTGAKRSVTLGKLSIPD